MLRSLIPIAAIFFVLNAHAVVSPSEVNVGIYAIAISTNADCSNPIVIVNNNGTAHSYDFVSNPYLGSPSTPIPKGDYKCVILKMSDVITFKPSSSQGSCTAGTTYTIDVCRTTQGTYTPMTITGSTATFGTAGTDCTGTSGSPVDTQVPLFLSTQSATVTGGGAGSAFDRPTTNGSTNGFKLNGEFKVRGHKSGTFVVDFNNKVDGSGGTCDLNPPTFGFR